MAIKPRSSPTGAGESSDPLVTARSAAHQPRTNFQINKTMKTNEEIAGQTARESFLATTHLDPLQKLEIICYALTEAIAAKDARINELEAQLVGATSKPEPAAEQSGANQLRVKQWMIIANQVVNETPTMPDLKTLKLRARLILEEAMETISKGFGLDVMADGQYPFDHLSTFEFIHAREPSMIEIADGLSDLEVVSKGAAVSCGIPSQACFDEVMDSNDSKFIWAREELPWLDPSETIAIKKEMPDGTNFIAAVKDAGGKILKPENYKKANLAPILGINP